MERLNFRADKRHWWLPCPSVSAYLANRTEGPGQRAHGAFEADSIGKLGAGISAR
jgi:hypothetical protein